MLFFQCKCTEITLVDDGKVSARFWILEVEEPLFKRHPPNGFSVLIMSASPGEDAPKALPRRDSDLSSHQSNSRRRLNRSWSGASGGSGGSESNLLQPPPGVRPPSATRVRQRQGIAMRPSEKDIVVKSGPTVEEKAATRITAAARGHAARRQVRTLRAESQAVKSMEAAKQAEAATKITAVVKGNATRKRVAALKKAESERVFRAKQEADARAAREAAEAAIREAVLREQREQEAKLELATRTAELTEELHSLQAGIRERDRQLGRLKGDLASQVSLVYSRDATIEELKLRIKELEAEIAHLQEMMKLAEYDIRDGKEREAQLEKKIKSMAKPPTRVRSCCRLTFLCVSGFRICVVVLHK